MGNENRRNDFDQENWQILSKIGVKTILKNKMTFSLLDLYECDEKIQLSSSRKAESIFEWRKNIKIQEHIPLLYHFQLYRAMIGSTQHHKVFTEHITRLSQLPPISKQEAFLILEQIIEALPTLYKHFGLFYVNIYTIGINDSGSTKVWINENLSKNYPEEEDIIKNPSKHLQLNIVNNLVRMLKTKVYNNQIKPEYPFSLNFLQTLRFIKETRKKYSEYAVGKVYLNRSEFNQAYKIAINQKIIVESNINQNLNPIIQTIKFQRDSDLSDENRNKQMTPRLQTQPIKTESSQPPIQVQYSYQPQMVNFNPPPPLPQQYQPFPKPNSQQFIYYPINALPFNQVPLYNKQQTMRNGQKQQQVITHHQNRTIPFTKQSNQQQLEQTYYLTPSMPNNVPIQQQQMTPSPAKHQRSNTSPSKFLKKISLEKPRQISPKKQIKNQEPRINVHQNRSISLSPARKRQNKTVIPQKQQPNWIRPVSINKQVVRRELSRIVQQEQTKFDSFYMHNPDKKTQQGFNVQLVESIYVKTNQTEQGF